MSKTISNNEKCKEVLQAQSNVWNHILSYINSLALKCAVELGIPDAIHNHGKAMTLCDLAASLPINQAKAPCLSRLMRTLVHSGFFAEQLPQNPEAQGAYLLTPSSRLFIKEDPLNLTSFLTINLHPISIGAWHSLGDWFKNDDKDAFTTAYQMPMWEFSASRPGRGQVFNEAMACDTRLILDVLMNGGYEKVFQGSVSLVDVGGGTGTLARAIARKFPNLKCTVFDMPQVVGDLKGSENLEFVTGDMFVAIPPSNTILLKWILHNWDDENCLKILKNCKEALIQCKDKVGKLIIIDMVVENKKKNDEFIQSQLYFDLLMMVNLGGKERDEKEWAKLFSDSGFSNYKITHALGSRSLIEKVFENEDYAHLLEWKEKFLSNVATF